MKKLTDYQKEFILNTFFYLSNHAGWKNIATKLLENGECIVAGDKCIWVGVIGNFIKVSNAPDFFGCVKYSFDLEYFMESVYFMASRDFKVGELETAYKEAKEVYEDIKNLG